MAYYKYHPESNKYDNAFKNKKIIDIIRMRCRREITYNLNDFIEFKRIEYLRRLIDEGNIDILDANCCGWICRYICRTEEYNDEIQFFSDLLVDIFNNNIATEKLKKYIVSGFCTSKGIMVNLTIS